MEPGDRKRQLVTTATQLAERTGYQKVTRESLAKRARCSEALITFHFGSMDRLRTAMMRHAVENSILPVIAQGLAANDPHAKKAPEDLKRRALLAAVR
jgi:AcrR family transcriptional regulator